MFSLGSFPDLCADPFPFIMACSRGAGVGVEGVDTAAACLLVLTPDDMLQELSLVQQEKVAVCVAWSARSDVEGSLLLCGGCYNLKERLYLVAEKYSDGW